MKPVTVWLALLAVSILFGSAAANGPGPSLPLPTPSAGQLEESGLPADIELTNSVRAWFYNPSLVGPLLEVGAAVEDSILTLEVRRMLAVVVASRNQCLY